MSSRGLVRAGLLVLAIACLPISGGAAEGDAVGLFTGHGDIGVPSTLGPGSASYDPRTKVYTVAGGGENMWATADHFHYVWKKVSGDVMLDATLEFVGTAPETSAPDPHRKACLVIRQTLDSDSVYADAARHGDGLTSLQWRDTKGGVTHEVQSSATGPIRLRLEKRGSYVSMSIAKAGEPLRPSGGAAKVELTGDFYIGLAVSAHNPGRIEKVNFSDVQLTALQPVPTAAASRTTIVNTLETISLRSRDRRVAYVVTQPGRIESPLWFPDASNTLYFVNGGRLHRVQADPPGTRANPDRLATPVPVDFGTLTGVSAGFGVTRDTTHWALGVQSPNARGQQPSLIYTSTGAGTPPKRVAVQGSAHVYGWSPDGTRLLYSTSRNGNVDLYTASAEGTDETRLTTVPARDLDAAFTPDGQSIYFSSDRSGSMQIWRMKADGSQQEQVTRDDGESRFPHVAPNGQLVAFLTFPKGTGEQIVNRDVTLRVLNARTNAIDTIAALTGGKGTLDADPWSPNSQYLAFVSYQVVPR